MAHTKLNTFHLFAGAGGGILGDLLLGHNPIGACEIEPYPRNVLLARQADGHLPSFPIWDDVATLDGNPWRGSVDILCGGFPCQDISAAGKGAGITGERSGLWKEYARLIGEMRPRFVFAENSPLLRTRGLGVVLEDLASLGYNARWGVLGAGAVGAPHKRDRMWVLAYTESGAMRDVGKDEREGCNEVHSPDNTGGLSRGDDKFRDRKNEMAHTRCQHGQQGNTTQLDSSEEEWSHGSILNQSSGEGLRQAWWHTDPAEISYTDLHDGGNVRGIELGEEKLSEPSEPREIHKPNNKGTEEKVIATEPAVGRVAHGVANRVDRLKAIGNGQVPQCAAVAFNILSEGLT